MTHPSPYRLEIASLRIKLGRLLRRYQEFGGVHTPWTSNLVRQIEFHKDRLRILSALDTQVTE